ncbi:MAG: cobalt/nickel transport system permease protein [Actinomycetota bacterium]|nr:cobalt/nickel transport system permease protein [Actinomycetota bacterium]
MNRQRVFLVTGLLITLVLAGFVSTFASSSPDGLEKVAEDQGFAGTARKHPLAGSPVEGYAVAGVDDEHLSGALAGVIGVGATLALGGGLFLVLRRRP